MTLFLLTPYLLERAKKRLRPLFPDVKSSHLSEALAAALGFKTHAAILKEVEQFDPENGMEIMGISESAFYDRLQSLGASFSEVPGSELFELPIHPEYPSALFMYDQLVEPDIAYIRPRVRAWRNLMVAAINAGIEQGLFSLRKSDNRWPPSEKPFPTGPTYKFQFLIFPCLCCVMDAGNGELAFHAAFFPKPDIEKWMDTPQIGLTAGEAYGMAWLEREKEARLETSMSFFKAKKDALPILAEAEEITPQGYRDH